jgi:hypothetical protein
LAATNTGGRSHNRDTSGRSFVPSHSGRNDNNNFVPHKVWSILTPAQRIAIARDRREGKQASVQGSSHGGYGRGGRSYTPYFRGGGRGRYYSGRGGRLNNMGREINAVSIDNRAKPSDMSQLTETAAPTQTQNNARQSFGRSSYSNYRQDNQSSSSTPRANNN